MRYLGAKFNAWHSNRRNLEMTETVRLLIEIETNTPRNEAGRGTVCRGFTPA